MGTVLLLTAVFSLAAAISICLLGDRSLLAPNLLAGKNVLHLILHWKFILSMSLAVVARFTFIFINKKLLEIPSMAPNSTTIAGFITALSYVFVILANYLVLKERLNLQQGTAALLILLGIWLMLTS